MGFFFFCDSPYKRCLTQKKKNLPVLGMQVGSSSLVKSYHASKVRNEGKLSLYFHMLFMTGNDVKYAISVRNDG